MVRRVFFSFEYSGDVWRANVVRKSWVTQSREAAGFIDAAEFEKVERQNKQAIKNWIDGQLKGTSVTVVLVGAKTRASDWVRYEIEESKRIGNGLLGINISGIKDQDGNTTTCCAEMPAGYRFYRWGGDNGRKNMGDWIDAAAKAAGR